MICTVKGLSTSRLTLIITDIPEGCRLYFLGLINVINWLLATKMANTRSWGEETHNYYIQDFFKGSVNKGYNFYSFSKVMDSCKKLQLILAYSNLKKGKLYSQMFFKNVLTKMMIGTEPNRSGRPVKKGGIFKHKPLTYFVPIFLTFTDSKKSPIRQ